MGFKRTDVEETALYAKKFVRYDESARKYSMGLSKFQTLQRDQLDGLDLYAAGKATVNDTFDRYMATKFELRDSTRNGYLYTYAHLIRDKFGFKKLVDLKYSDVLQFY